MGQLVVFAQSSISGLSAAKLKLATLLMLTLCIPPLIVRADDADAPTPDSFTSDDDPCNDSVPYGVCVFNPQPDVVSSDISPRTTVGNPVSLVSGNKYQFEQDYSVSGSKLEFSRHYNSARINYNSGFGRGWSATYASRIAAYEDGGFAISESTGRVHRFDIEEEGDNGITYYRGSSTAQGRVWHEDGVHYWSMPDGRKLTFSGRFLVHVDYPGHQSLSLYYRNERIAEVTDEAGRVLKFEYNDGEIGLSEYESVRFKAPPGHLKRLTLPDGSTIEYDYDNNLNLSRTRYSDGSSREFHYEDEAYPNHLTGISDRLGNRYATWSYNDAGYAVSSEHGDGVERVTLDYELPVNPGDVGITNVTNSQGEVSTYRWQRDHHSGDVMLLSSEGPGCATCPRANMRYTYTDDNQLSVTTDPAGTERHYHYDDAGRLSQIDIVSDFGSQRVVEQRFEYENDDIRPVRVFRPSVNPDGEHSVEVRYNNNRLPIEVTESGFAPIAESEDRFSPISRTTRFEYEQERISLIDGPREDVADVTRFSYDQLGRLRQMSLPSGEQVVISEYDEHGRAVEYRNGHNPTVTVSYDSNGNVTRIGRLGLNVDYIYNAENRLSSVTNPNGKVTTLSYDEARRLTGVTDDMGRTTELTLNTESQLVDQSYYGINGGLIRSLNFVFDAEGRLQSATEDKNNYASGNLASKTVNLEYDEIGRLSTITDSASGAQRQYAFNELGRLLEQIEPNGLSVSNVYDVHDRLIAETDMRLNTTRLIRDDFGRVNTLISPDTGTTHYKFDAAGNRVEKRNANREKTSYRWDAANRLVEQVDPEGTTRYEYHKSNGRLIGTSNPDTNETFSYTQYSQLSTHTRFIDEHSFTTEYLYEGNGKLKNKILPDGQSLRYHYHESGPNQGTLRAITRESFFGLNQTTVAGEIDLDNRDGATSFLSHNGRRNESLYQPDGKVSSISVNSALTLEYDYDDQGKIVGISKNGFEQRYGYKAGQLSQASTVTGTYDYSYDVAGNRTSSSSSESDSDFNNILRYSDLRNGNRLESIMDTNTAVSQSYTYNDAGSPIRLGELRYEYNANQRPVRVMRGSQTIAEYGYNSFGERIKKVAYSQNQKKVTYYLYDQGQLSAEIDADSLEQRHHVYLDHTPVAYLADNTIYSVHSDHLGTPKLITNDAGDSVWEASHTPLGQAHLEQEDIRYNLRFPGQYADAETGTHYNYLRDYDPRTGRYLTSDPVGLEGGKNTYAYASNNVLGAIDRLGLSSQIAGLPLEPGSTTNELPFSLRNGGVPVSNPSFSVRNSTAQPSVASDDLILNFSTVDAGCRSNAENVANFDRAIDNILPHNSNASVLNPNVVQFYLHTGPTDTGSNPVFQAAYQALLHLGVDENSHVLAIRECASDDEVRTAVTGSLGNMVRPQELNAIIESLGPNNPPPNCRRAQFVDLTALHAEVLVRFEVQLATTPEVLAAEKALFLAQAALEDFLRRYPNHCLEGSDAICIEYGRLKSAVNQASDAYADALDRTYDAMLAANLLPKFDEDQAAAKKRQDIMLSIVGIFVPLTATDLAIEAATFGFGKLFRGASALFDLFRGANRVGLDEALALGGKARDRVDDIKLQQFDHLDIPGCGVTRRNGASTCGFNAYDFYRIENAFEGNPAALAAFKADINGPTAIRAAIQQNPSLVNTYKFLHGNGGRDFPNIRGNAAALESVHKLTGDIDFLDAVGGEDGLRDIIGAQLRPLVANATSDVTFVKHMDNVQNFVNNHTSVLVGNTRVPIPGAEGVLRDMKNASWTNQEGLHHMLEGISHLQPGSIKSLDMRFTNTCNTNCRFDVELTNGKLIEYKNYQLSGVQNISTNQLATYFGNINKIDDVKYVFNAKKVENADGVLPGGARDAIIGEMQQKLSSPQVAQQIFSNMNANIKADLGLANIADLMRQINNPNSLLYTFIDAI